MAKVCERTTTGKLCDVLESLIKEEKDAKGTLDAFFGSLKDRINRYDEPIDISCECQQYLMTYEQYSKSHILVQQIKAYLKIENQ